MDHPDGVAKGKPDFDPHVLDRLVCGSVMGMWPFMLLLGAFLHVGSFRWPPLHLEEDS